MISKASLEAYCRVARQELALKGIRLSVIRPGAIRTPLLNWMDNPVDDRKYPVYTNELKKSWAQSVKMVGRVTTPDKVAGIILKASESRRPKRIYRINNSVLLRFIALLPDCLTEKIIIRKFRRESGSYNKT
jgi:NAD(P)-dependent dehydrogenase (short-subunit alcohol dehydrogenase family)